MTVAELQAKDAMHTLANIRAIVGYAHEGEMLEEAVQRVIKERDIAKAELEHAITYVRG